MKNKIQELYALEQLANGNTCVHRLHPTVKLLATIVFIITVVSFDRYSFTRLAPYIFIPTILMAFAEIPYTILLKRFLIALPFCFFAGIANILFDRATAFTIGNLDISYGLVSLFTILFRVYLCVMAVLVFVSATPLAEIVNAMRRLKLPYVFVTVFEMTYRYIGVLFEEAYSMYTAYSLRSVKARGIAIRDMGSFIGQLLFRSIDRADRVYNAMQCRGYSLRQVPQNCGKLAASDCVFFLFICLFCIFFRFVDVYALITGIGEIAIKAGGLALNIGGRG